jgi:hypothetical protein
VQKEIIRISRSKLTCALEMEAEGICRIVEKAPLLHSWCVFVFNQQTFSFDTIHHTAYDQMSIS